MELRLPHAPWRFDVRGYCMANRAAIAWLATLAFLMSLHGRFPYVAWAAGMATVVGLLALWVRALPPRERRWLLGCVLVAGGIHAAAIALFGYHDPRFELPRQDAYDYWISSNAVARAWGAGEFPALHRRGDLPYLGTLHTGYQRILATLFLLFHPSVRLVIAFNVLCGALLPVVAYLLALRLFAADACGAAPCDASGDPRGWLEGKTPGALMPLAAPEAFWVARAAAFLCALDTSYVYWARWVMKDVCLALLFGISLLFLVDFLRRRRPAAAGAFLFAVFFLAIMRAYSGMAILVGLALYVAALMPRRMAWWILFYLACTAGLLGYTSRFGDIMAQLWHSLLNPVPSHIVTLKAAAVHFGMGIPRFWLGPYAWVQARGEFVQYGVYPAMWYLYLVIYPLSFAGLVRAARGNHLLTVIPLACVWAGGMIYLLAYGGESNRQRLWLEVIFVVYAALGIGERRRRLCAAVFYALLVAFACVQLVSLRIRDWRAVPAAVPAAVSMTAPHPVAVPGEG